MAQGYQSKWSEEPGSDQAESEPSLCPLPCNRLSGQQEEALEGGGQEARGPGPGRRPADSSRPPRPVRLGSNVQAALSTPGTQYGLTDGRPSPFPSLASESPALDSAKAIR